MVAYIHASGLISAKNCQKRTACQLAQALELPYFNAFDNALLSLDDLTHLLIQQVETCVNQAGWQMAELAEIPILLGSTAYTIADCEWRFEHNQPLPNIPNITAVAERLKSHFGSPVFSIATSCTSSAQAIGYAVKMIEQGKYKKAIVLGFEMFNRLTFEHFQAMGLLAQTTDSGGIILGEGVGCIALSDEPSDCQILDVVSLTDNDSLTNSSVDSLQYLINQILQRSGLDFSMLDGIKPHFVGGQFDEAEQVLLQENGLDLAKQTLWRPKKLFGHTLGASGAMETAWLMAYLQKNQKNRPLVCLNYFLGFGGSHIAWILKWKP